MTPKHIHVRPGLTALGAVLAITSTSLFAQSVPPTPDTTTAPATSSTPPATDTTATTPAPDTQTSTPADTAAPVDEPAAKPVKAKAAAAAPRAAKPVHAAAAAAPAPAPVKASAPPARMQVPASAPPPVATGTEKIVAPNPIVKTGEPAAAPVQFAQPQKPAPWSSYLSNEMNPAAAAGALGVIALAGAGIGLRRRRRRRLEEEEAAQWDDSQSVEPDAEMQPAWAAAAPVAAAEQQPESAGESRLPNGFDLSRFGPHVQAAYRGPTEDNPSLSLRHRLRRAAAMDQMERRAAAQPNELAPASAEKPFMLADRESVNAERTSDESELTH